MKAHLMIVAYSVLFACCTVSTFAANKNRLDITLEGPWILYEDHAFAGSTPVLVAFAPGGAGRFAHKPPAFSSGMGFPIERPGTYCIGFDKVCAVNRGVPALSHAEYPKTAAEPLQVKSAPGWKWYQHRDRLATYLIFPMPNSYSDNGTYKMTFGTKFGKYDYSKEQERSIGVELHYDSSPNGPSTLDLYDCGAAPKSPSDCTILVGSQNNSGTLEITMKAPATLADYACDYHVRAVYPQMLQLIDPGNTYNQDKGFIDIPVDIDPTTGKGSYDASCYVCDEQSLDLSHCPITAEAMYSPMLDVRVELNKIIDELSPLTDQNELQVPELRSIAKSLEGGSFPTFAQLERITVLLSRSDTQLSRDLMLQSAKEEDSAERVNANAIPARLPSFTLQDALSQVQQLASYATALDATKDAKDCRAPLMLLE
jgi:hypothetical protein